MSRQEEILESIVAEDAAKMLLADSEITQSHNGIEYKMVRNELALEAMSEFSKEIAIGFKKFTSLYFNGEVVDNPDENIPDEQLFSLYMEEKQNV